MLGLSLGEVLLIMLVGFLVLGPAEMTRLVSELRGFINKVQQWYHQYYGTITDSLPNSEQEIVKYIIDMDGNVQRTYDLTKIMPDLKTNNISSKKDEDV